MKAANYSTLIEVFFNIPLLFMFAQSLAGLWPNKKFPRSEKEETTKITLLNKW